jgi:hypothetical protein
MQNLSFIIRYPDYKFTPKKKKTKNEATFKVMDGQKMTTEEVLYTNIHDMDYSPLKERAACAFTGIDPVIAAAASAAQAYPNQYSFQDFLSSTYPFLDQSMLKLLQPYDPNLMPVMPLVDPTLYPEQPPELNEPITESAECTPMLEYSESPVDGFLDSPSTAYPPSFPLSNAYGPSIYDNQDLIWKN